MEKSKPTVVIGASTNPERYSYKAAAMLKQNNQPIYLVSIKKGEVMGHPIYPFGTVFNEPIDTVTLYLNPEAQKQYYSYILSLKPKRIIFNPGTENPELANLAESSGIEVVSACTLVLLSTKQF